MPAWLITLLPYFLTVFESLMPLLEQGLNALEASHPATGPMADVQTNVQAAIKSIQAAIAAKPAA